MAKIDFVKTVASGNDFIIIDNFKGLNSTVKSNISNMAKKLCQRKLSVGADGLLLIEPSKKTDLKMRIFNPDGMEVAMCGNGSRCLALYAYMHKIVSSNKMFIETAAGNIQAEIRQDKTNLSLTTLSKNPYNKKVWVQIKMPPVKDLRLELELNVNGQMQNLNYINTGVPHVVSFVRELDSFDVDRTGKEIRYHCEFQPEGTNADFVEVLDKDHIYVRTYERGVEQETLSCGTGAVAASIIASFEMEQRPRKGKYTIKVDTYGRESLFVYFTKDKDIIGDVFLEGQAKIMYEGGTNV